ncbi:MAG TPA: acetylornithine deacetylase [Aliidongia sp.]|nr:acetylornithine deacetylase [Aliidongia sp.]
MLGDRQILERLIAFDTTSVKSNLALIDWIADFLDGEGIEVTLSHDEADPHHSKANLFATIGPEIPGGVMLSGHTDVVPVDGQDWSSDPFALTERDDRFYARGSADMKAFIALALSRTAFFKEKVKRMPVHFAFSFDEEVGCLGVRHLIKHLPTGPARPQLAIIGEPTLLQPVNAHKGGRRFTTTVVGLDGHSSATHRGVSAISFAAEIIRKIDQIADRFRETADPASPFDPPYTTFNVGTIHGGTAQNIIARECRFTWEFRAVPGTDTAAIIAEVEGFIAGQILPRMQRVYPGASVTTKPEPGVPPLTPEKDGKAENLVRQLTGANGTGVVAFGTEAGLFQEVGMSAIVCGPGSIDQAHKPDEWISLEQFQAGGTFMDRFGAWIGNQG